MAKVGLGQATVELPEADDGLVGVFPAGAVDRIEYTNGRVELDDLARCCHQLFHGPLMTAWFPQDLAIQHGELVGTDDERVAGVP